MKNNKIVSQKNKNQINTKEYTTDIDSYFSHIPDIAKPLIKDAKINFKKIEQLLYTTPSIINMIKSSFPEYALQAVLTDEQKSKLAKGILKLMTKKDGKMMANLVDPKTNRIVSTISLEEVRLSPELNSSIANFATQMQLAQIAKEIHSVQLAIEEVIQGQESDRLATAYSCEQKLLQAMQIKNPQLKVMALMRIVHDAEDSRNLLMLSQNDNLLYIKEQPETFWGKLKSGAKPEKISGKINSIRESLSVVNMVSLVEAIAYNELGEYEAARQSLQYYATYLENTYFSSDNLIQRLDSIDPSPENYWSKMLPNIKIKIQALPLMENIAALKGETNE